MNQLVTRGSVRKFEVGDKLLEKYINQTTNSTYFYFLVASICGSNVSNDPWGIFLSKLYLTMYNDFNNNSFIGFKCYNKYYHKLTPEVYSGISSEFLFDKSFDCKIKTISKKKSRKA